LIDKNYVSDADPARGKFRTFLLTSLTNFLANEHDKRSALKRGGDLKQFSLEYEVAERRYSIEPTTSDSPAKQFEQRWARHLLERVVQQLQQEYVDAGKADVFENLKQFLVTTDTEPATVIAQRLGMSEAAVRVAGHRLRNQYRAMVRQEIAATVGNCEEVDDEIAALFAAFTPGKKSFRESV
jgi:DNA-directed RNA polymerase specialized sigma24 family protein